VIVAEDGVVVLREIGPQDGALLRQLASAEEAGPFNTFDEDDEHLALADVGGGRMIVATADGEPVGDVSWFGVPYGPTRRSLAWRIGITVVSAQRGRGYGARAQRLLADHLLATTSSNRVEADVDVGNVAERRALERAGFTAEGVLRGAQHRGGGWHDLVMYARLRGDALPPLSASRTAGPRPR
jgi:RimJ/RimL family protein N-acetyltransferase